MPRALTAVGLVVVLACAAAYLVADRRYDSCIEERAERRGGQFAQCNRTVFGDPGPVGGNLARVAVPDAPDTMTLESPAFRYAATIPRRYGCLGDDVSPALRWAYVPRGTRAQAVVVFPGAEVEGVVGWALVDLPPDVRRLEEGAAGEGIQAPTTFASNDYRGPCPGEEDGGSSGGQYVVYALREKAAPAPGATVDDVLAEIERQALAMGTLNGGYDGSG